MVYKMFKIILDKTSRYQVQNKKNTGNGNTGQELARNWKETRSNKSQRSSRVYSTFHTLIQ